MSDIERLKELDPQEIYKKTYIAPKVVQYLTEGDFSKIGNRTKALGFITILERELGLDLSELREKIDEYYGIHQENSVFEIKEKEEQKRGGSWIWIALALLFLAGGYYFYTSQRMMQIQKGHDEFLVTSETNETQEQKESSAQPLKEEASKTSLISESNTTEANVSKVQSVLIDKKGGLKHVESNETNETNESLSQESLSQQTLTFIPKKKLWLGIIYLDDFSRKQYVTSSPVEINTSRDQLIVTGHGLFKIEQNNKIEEFKEQGKQRFIYRAGELEKIDAATFKRYNRGRTW